MTRLANAGRVSGSSLVDVIEGIFGRWPAWPWSVLGIVLLGAAGGMAGAPAFRRVGWANPTAFGPAACAGYGLVAAALLTLLPQAWRLASLRHQLIRRPISPDAPWWPLDLLAAALQSTPSLRRTPEEFATAVAAAGGQTRTFLGHRLWPAWVTAFVAPVLGLITAWQVGAQVIRRQGDTTDILPAFIAQVSPPMVGTIAAALVLMVAIVVIDQCTKGLLQRWSGIVQPGDADHPAVIEKLGTEGSRSTSSRDGVSPERSEVIGAASVPQPPREALPTHPLDPTEIERIWQQSASQNH